MNDSFWQRLDALARQLVPCALTIALAFAAVVPLHIPSFEPVAPSLPLVATFYWTLHRPDLMPVWAVFVLGILQDALIGLPAGVSACMLTATHAAVIAQRGFLIGRSFAVVWLSFGLVTLGASTLGWALTCAFHGALLAPTAALFQALMTFGAYPIVSRLLSSCEASLLGSI
jgi:rod shape-determining protein MreD